MFGKAPTMARLPRISCPFLHTKVTNSFYAVWEYTGPSQVWMIDIHLASDGDGEIHRTIIKRNGVVAMIDQ